MTTKPPAEIIGDFGHVLKQGKCTDGRILFALERGDEETFVLAGTKLQAWKKMFPLLGTMTRMTQGRMSDRYKADAAASREKLENGEPEEPKSKPPEKPKKPVTILLREGEDPKH